MTTSNPPTALHRRPNANWLLLIPSLALLTAILLVPLFQSLLRSLQRSVTEGGGWTLDNYVKLFTDGVTMTVLGRTASTALIVTLVAFLLGYPYAYFMTRVSDRTRAVLLVIVPRVKKSLSLPAVPVPGFT